MSLVMVWSWVKTYKQSEGGQAGMAYVKPDHNLLHARLDYG